MEARSLRRLLISFSSSTASEAESRFNSGAEALSSAPNDANLFDKGRLCPHAHFFTSDEEEYQKFRQIYEIPDDVMLNRVRSGQIRDKVEDRPKHITVPLMACEAGLRFPLHPFLREILARFSLAPHQLAINSYRIIMSVIALKESHNLSFSPADLFDTYVHHVPTRPYQASVFDKIFGSKFVSSLNKLCSCFLENF